jgi:hypothetical protein
MADSGYSTEALRTYHKRTDTTWVLDYTDKDTLRVTSRNLCRSILEHRTEYDTGTFNLAMPGGDGETVTISGLFPPSGSWLGPGRLAEIENYLAKVGHDPYGPAHVFAGFPVQLNGSAATLECTERGGPPRYYFRREDGHRVQGRLGAIPPVPHDFLVELLADGFNSRHPLPRLAPTDDPVPALEGAARAAHARFVELAAVQAGRFDRLDLNDVPEDTTRAALSRRYADGEVELERLQAAAERAQKELLAALTPHPSGVHQDRVLDLLRALADPRSHEARKLMDGELTLGARHEIIAEPGHVDRHRVEITLRLPIHNGRDSWTLLRTGSYDGGPAAKVIPRLTAAVDGLRDGIPLYESLGSDWPRWLPQIRSALGPSGGRTRAHVIDDPRLRCLYMQVIHPPSPDAGHDPHHPRLAGPPVPDGELADLADRLGEPVPLIRRIAEVYRVPPPGYKWLRDSATVAAAAYRSAAATGQADPADLGRPGAGHQLVRGQFGPEWMRIGGVLVLSPCTDCGRTNRVPLRLREVDGSVCSDCRTDRSGVPWPPEYDRYAHSIGRLDDAT